jgi:hypothetical protein
MPYTVDFNTVSTVGLESSPVAAALAGLRAHEARYFKNKYDHVFKVEPASNANTTIDWVHRILKEERDIVISSRPLEATVFQLENIRIAYVFYESGLSINVMYTVDDPRSGRSGSSCPKRWKSPQSSPHGSSSRSRSRSWPGPFAAPTSPSRTSTDPRPALRCKSPPAGVARACWLRERHLRRDDRRPRDGRLLWHAVSRRQHQPRRSSHLKTAWPNRERAVAR